MPPQPATTVQPSKPAASTPTQAPAAPAAPTAKVSASETGMRGIAGISTDEPRVSPTKPSSPDPKAPAPSKAPEAPKPDAVDDAPDAVQDDQAPPAEPTKKATSLGDDLDSIRAKKPTGEPKGDGTPKQLREAYTKTKEELATYQAKVKDLEAAVAKAAQEGRQAAEAALQKKLDDANAERDRLDSEMRYVQFERSNEFQTKYQKPITSAWEMAERDLKGVKVTLGDGESRDATVEDIYPLLSLPAAHARRKAIELFGEDAGIILPHRDRILEKIEAARIAREEWKAKGAERATEIQEQQTRMQRDFNIRIDARIKELADTAPDYFGDPKEDPEESALVAKAGDIVDVALGRKGFKEGIPPQEQAQARADAIATVAARAKHFGRLVLKLTRVQEELETANAKLKAYETSEPTPTPVADTKPAKRKTPEEGLAAIAQDSY